MRKFTLKPKIYLAFFERFPGYIAVLDERGNILATNKTWQESALTRGLIARADCIGYNYFKLLEGVSEEEKPQAKEIKEGLEKVLRGDLSYFRKPYAFYEPDGSLKKYLLTFFPLPVKPKLFVIYHEEILSVDVPSEKSSSEGRSPQSPLKEEKGTSLHINELTSLDKIVLPFLELLQDKLPSELEHLRRKTLEEIKKLKEDRMRKLHPLANLSTKEAQVALMVKEGHSSEEICKLLNLSKDAVNFYRKKIREKFGLKGKRISLKKFLNQIL
ncbi:MAG: helix-turn-helix transcriptional regulator [Caldimicrobium sp.]|nr:helix-turn-helix transcriptional regulator [Caldimicrobium sp.]MCX7873772.1 helix-turn-helix transcriptional regulator [Caldimicrobium sp.]MDW8093696.1 LuxR C-terminal-related transcriptional regulator [Caldimicrobium sp.]